LLAVLRGIEALGKGGSSPASLRTIAQTALAVLPVPVPVPVPVPEDGPGPPRSTWLAASPRPRVPLSAPVLLDSNDPDR
jgi:hypothetical protein